MALLFQTPFWQFFDDDGNPLAGGKVYTYAATTTTPKATYTDSAAGTQHENPIILDDAGRATVWGVGSYKIVVTDADDNPIGDPTDNYTLGGGLVSFTGQTTTRSYALPDANDTIACLGQAQTFTKAQFIDGSADAIQLRVQANATNTNAVVKFENSVGERIFQQEENGNITWGDAETATAGSFDCKNAKTSGTVMTLRAYGDDSGGNETFYGGIEISVLDATNGSEDGQFGIFTNVAGDGGASYVARFANGVQVGSPTGGFKGVGTLNATAVYDDNSLLTDYVLDYFIDGSIDLEKYDASAQRTHEPARGFISKMDDVDLFDIEAYSQDWKETRKLPAFYGEDSKSTGEAIQRITETLEIFAVHMLKIHERLKVIEA